MAVSSSIYENALKSITDSTNNTRKRTQQGQQNFNSVLSLIESQKRMSDIIKLANGDTTTRRDATKQANTHDASVRNLMEGRGPSRGPNNVNLATWKFEGRPVTSEAGATAKKFQGLLRDLEAHGYNVKSAASYSNRNARGSNRLSEHAYGRAIDINPGQNPMRGNLVTDMPRNTSQIARAHGLVWGGDWKSKKDPMHFSTTGW
jgi:hypothetical protein